MKVSLETAGQQAIEMTARNQRNKEFIYHCAMQSNAEVKREKEAHLKEQKALIKHFLKNMAIAWAGIIVFAGLMAVL